MSSSKLSFSTIILKVRKQSVRKNSSFFPTLPALVSLTPYLSLPYLGSGRIVTYPDIPSYMVKYPTIHSPPKPHRHKNEKKIVISPEILNHKLFGSQVDLCSDLLHEVKTVHKTFKKGKHGIFLIFEEVPRNRFVIKVEEALKVQIKKNIRYLFISEEVLRDWFIVKVKEVLEM